MEKIKMLEEVGTQRGLDEVGAKVNECVAAVNFILEQLEKANTSGGK